MKHAKIYDRQTWFSRLVRHPARKRNGSILTTPKPAQGVSSIALRNRTGYAQDHPAQSVSFGYSQDGPNQ